MDLDYLFNIPSPLGLQATAYIITQSLVFDNELVEFIGNFQSFDIITLENSLYSLLKATTSF